MEEQFQNDEVLGEQKPQIKYIKIIMLLLSATVLLIFSVWFFSPKNITSCGSILPVTCQECICTRGIPFGGFPETHCLFGKLECFSISNQNLTMSTTDWQTYEDNSVGFSLKYPPDWYKYGDLSSSCCLYVKNFKFNLVTYDLENGQIKIEIRKYIKPASKSLETFAHQQEYYIAYQPKTEPVIIGGIQGIKFDISGYSAYFLPRFQTEGLHIEIFYNVENKDNEDSKREPPIISQQILSTFKFISTSTLPETSTSIDDWKTYKDERYGFEFKYPDYIKDTAPYTEGLSRIDEAAKLWPKYAQNYKGYQNEFRIGHDIFTILITPNDRKFGEEYGLQKDDSYDSPLSMCKTISLENKNIRAVKCGTEEGSYVSALITGKNFDIFVNGTHSGILYYLGIEDNYIKTDDYPYLLSTFKFIEPSETGSSTYCAFDNDCWCRPFDGTKFYPGKAPSICNLQTNTCNTCYYE